MEDIAGQVLLNQVHDPHAAQHDQREQHGGGQVAHGVDMFAVSEGGCPVVGVGAQPASRQFGRGGARVVRCHSLRRSSACEGIESSSPDIYIYVYIYMHVHTYKYVYTCMYIRIYIYSGGARVVRGHSRKSTG